MCACTNVKQSAKSCHCLYFTSCVEELILWSHQQTYSIHSGSEPCKSHSKLLQWYHSNYWLKCHRSNTHLRSWPCFSFYMHECAGFVPPPFSKDWQATDCRKEWDIIDQYCLTYLQSCRQSCRMKILLVHRGFQDLLVKRGRMVTLDPW